MDGEPRLRRNDFSGSLSWQSSRTVTCLFDVTSPTLSCGSNGFVVSDTTPFYPVCKVLSCPSSALLDHDTVEGLDCSSWTLGKAWEVTCADRYTAAGDTETPLTCVLNPELQSLLLEGFCSFMRVGAVRPQHTHASFHSESRRPEYSLRGALRRQLLVRQCSDFRDCVLPLY